MITPEARDFVCISINEILSYRVMGIRVRVQQEGEWRMRIKSRVKKDHDSK
jgi:hypothetical protein